MIAVLLSTILQTPDLVLSRGLQLTGPFAGVKDRYWDVTEAEIDSSSAESSLPNLFSYTGTSTRKVLLRFGSIDLATIRNSKIIDGTLILSLVEKDKAALRSIKVIKKPWVSPGVNVVARRIQGEAPKPAPQTPKGAKPVLPFAPGVTWNKAGGDTSNWQVPGASGSGDAEPIDAKISVKDSTIRVEGLGPTLQYWKTHEGENYGFLLEFSNETGFFSSISPEGRPRLELKLEQAAVKDPRFTISHEGDSVSLHAAEPINSVEVYKGTKKISSEKTAKISITSDNSSKDPRGSLMRIVTIFDDPAVPQEVVTIDPAGSWVKLTTASSRLWNQWYVDQSYYSFANYGAGKYVNGEGDRDDAFPPVPGVQDYANGSKMMDTIMPSLLVIPPRSVRNPLYRQIGIVDGGPLSLAQVDFLMNGKPQFPTVVLGKIVNADGRPIEDATVSVMAGGSETKGLKTDASGVILLPKFPAGTSGDVIITVESYGQTATLKTPSTTFSDLYARGNRKAIPIELPFNLSLWPINRDANLVQGKPTKDSANSFPAQLVGLTDDSADTAYTLPVGGWVEVDLGRDRTLGEIVFQGEMPKQFRVLVYGTTDTVEQAGWWIDEIDSARFRREYDITGDLTYQPTPNTARYVRIQNLSDKPARLTGLKIYAAKKPNS